MVNFIALIGWNPGTDEELFTMDELVESFSLEGVQKSGGVFDEVKLRWINHHYLKKKNKSLLLDGLAAHVSEDLLAVFKNSTAAFEDLIERTEVLSDASRMEEGGEFAYYLEQPRYESEGLIWKKGTKEDTEEHLKKVSELLSVVNEFTAENTKEALWDYATEQGRGDVLWPLRYALSGREKSPDPFVLCEILGRDETLKRVSIALKEL